MDETSLSGKRARYPPAHRATLALHGWIGFALLATFWVLNLVMGEGRTYWCYIPMWWGLALTIDALCLHNRGTSLLVRDWRKYLGLAMISVPAWWMFEALNNVFALNWYFVGGHLFTDFPAGLLGSSALSALMAVMFGSAELFAGMDIVKRGVNESVTNKRMSSRQRAIRSFVTDSLTRFLKHFLNTHSSSDHTRMLMFVSGAILLSFVILSPRYCYAFVWLGLFLLIEAINDWRGHSSLVRWVAQGDWRPVVCIALGGLVAGFFSELWNWQSNPKWIYDVPWFNVAHIFELPALGYLVFLSVGLELHAVYRLVMGLLGRKDDQYVYPICDEGGKYAQNILLSQ